MTTDLSNRSRQPKGSPVGGELKAERYARGEDLVEPISEKTTIPPDGTPPPLTDPWAQSETTYPTRDTLPDREPDQAGKGTNGETWARWDNTYVRYWPTRKRKNKPIKEIAIQGDDHPNTIPRRQEFSQDGTIQDDSYFQGRYYRRITHAPTYTTTTIAYRYKNIAETTQYTNGDTTIITTSKLPGVACVKETHSSGQTRTEYQYHGEHPNEWHPTPPAATHWWQHPGQTPEGPPTHTQGQEKTWITDEYVFTATYDGDTLTKTRFDKPPRFGILENLPYERTYSPSGEILTEEHIDDSGYITTLTYSPSGHIETETVTRPGRGNYVRRVYDENHNILSCTSLDHDGKVEHETYDIR